MNLDIASWPLPTQLAALGGAAFIISAGLILALWPLFKRYWVTSPNARSSHRRPTPQGGGFAVIAATTIVVAVASIIVPALVKETHGLWIVMAATIGLALVGATDDLRPLEAMPRLFLQAAAVFIVISTLPDDLRIAPFLPWWFERTCILLGGVWFINLTNFMDGIDCMTVAEVVPVTVGLTLFGLMGAIPPAASAVSIALCGAMAGFAPFNRPVARLFLGDVGSLPIGLLLFWLLTFLAGSGHLTAALLLPLYYIADATITLVRRLIGGEQVMQAHRSHFYQKAIDGGMSAYAIVGSVFAVNIFLAALATATLLSQMLWVHAVALIAGCISVGRLLYGFGRRKK